LIHSLVGPVSPVPQSETPALRIGRGQDLPRLPPDGFDRLPRRSPRTRDEAERIPWLPGGGLPGAADGRGRGSGSGTVCSGTQTQPASVSASRELSAAEASTITIRAVVSITDTPAVLEIRSRSAAGAAPSPVKRKT
jgi:hypothetical protein